MGGPVLLPPNFLDEFNALKEKVDRLANSPQAIATSVKEGAFTVLDNTGATRVRLGKDPVTGAYGVENYDGSGNLIFDSTGDRRVILKVAGTDCVQNQNYTEAVAAQDVTMVTAVQGFTLTRQNAVLFQSFISAKTTGAGGSFSYVNGSIRTTANNPATEVDVYYQGIWDKGIGGYYSFTGWHLSVLGAGTYYPVFTTFGDVGQTLALYTGHIDAFLLGG